MWHTFCGTVSDMEETMKRRPGRPATGVTPKRDIRIGPVWDEAAALASERGEKMAALVTRLLEREVRRMRREAEKPAEAAG